MSLKNDDQNSFLKQRYDNLTVEREQLFAEINFLLGKAIPKLEHEYLYCISLLEREATIVQRDVAIKNEIIRFYEDALTKNCEIDHEALQASLKKISEEWEEKINTHSYRSDTDFTILPKFSHEREHLKFLLHSTLNSMNINTSNRIEENYTELVRRITTAYREGNLGELRSLRMIIEGKQYLIDPSEQRFSFKSLRQFVTIRLRAFFSFSGSRKKSNSQKK